MKEEKIKETAKKKAEKLYPNYKTDEEQYDRYFGFVQGYCVAKGVKL